MKRLVSTVFVHFLVLTAVAQVGNEWIQHNQPYVRVPVGENGMHRITYGALQQAGFPLSQDPRQFQIFHRGIQQAIHIQGESDGIFHPSDYIEFYGKKNDGTLDSTLYESPSYQPHKHYNLYSDTTAYFLTIGAETGKRISLFSASSQSLTPEPFHWGEKFQVFKDNYSSGLDYGNVHKSVFDLGEGWTGSQIVHGQERTYVLEVLTDRALVSDKPVLEVLLTGRGPMPHEVEVYAGSRFMSRIVFQGYTSYRYVQQVEWSDVDASGTLSVRVRVTGSAGADRVSAGYIRLLFPQKVAMPAVTERLFIVNTRADSYSFLKIESPPVGVRLYDVTDPSTVVQLQGVLNSTYDVVVPAGLSRRKVLATTRVIMANNIQRVSFRQIDAASHNYIVITHPILRKPALGYLDPVKAFAEYRSLPEGGGFDTLVVNIDQLYDQFNYGEKSPRAIFQFMKYLASVNLPQYLFLVGKGLDVYYGYNRNPAAFNRYKDLVPTAGYPASDMAFTTGLGDVEDVHAVATGRLTANSPGDVAAYFNKVKEREALPFDDLNRKKILHLSGGIEESEPAFFRNILAEFGAMAEDQYLGGKVQAIAKQSTDVKLINIAEEVNRGLGLITFFGHSAPNTLDFDIGLVTDPVMGYNNPGKYPFLLMNGCDAGSFFLNTAIMGENWITTANKGAVGFIAHSSYGLVSSLQKYSSTFYNVAFRDSLSIRKGVGMVQKEVAKRYLESFGTSAHSLSQIQQMVLLGDPAIKIFGAEKPDYSPDAERVRISAFNDEPVTALSDSFRLHVPIRNTGIAGKKDMRIAITRQFGERTISYDSIIPGVLYSDTVVIVIRNHDKTGYGINTFKIQVDADDIISELNETNNTVFFEYFIPLNSTRNLYPYNFSIVNSLDVSLSFQYTDLLSEPREYLLEVDTAKTFNSGYKQQFVVSAKVLGRQPVNLLSTDSLVYYWRTRIAEPQAHDSKTWALSSFTYIEGGAEGWAQIDFPQYETNASTGLVKDSELKRMKFQETVSDIAVRAFSTSAGRPQDSVSFRINGVEFNLMYEGGACRDNTLNLVAFDRRSTQPYPGIYFKWYEILYEYGGRRLLCGREPYVINSFKPGEMITGNQDDLIAYVDNVDAGDSVVLFNLGDAGYEQWPQAAKEKLGSLGIAPGQLSDLRNGDALVIFGKKGSAPGTATIFHAAAPANIIKVNKTIAGRFTAGTMSSGVIGPAQNWKRFHNRVSEVEAPDNYRFSVVGTGNNGVADTLKTGLLSGDDLSFIHAGTHPYIKVVFEAADDVDLTSVQLSEWIVEYEPVAEGLVVYSEPVSAQVVREGQTLLQKFEFINISNKAFSDSLTVRYDLRNHNGGEDAPLRMKIAAPSPGDTTQFTVPLKTISKAGVNDVEVFVNPRILPEYSYDNNLVRLPGYVDVLTDNTDPVIDVTFDGRHLENDDYVSANPHIFIRVWDENLFLQKSDTINTRMFLAYPCDSGDCDFEPLYFSRTDITWHGATDTSDFQIVFLPEELSRGEYTLRVEASDGSGNTADAPYDIRFRVEPQETVVVPPAHPNPFSSQINLDVYITGRTSALHSYKFRVTTIDGRVVSELFSDTGFHVGKNSLRWDGSASDGRSLPNGLYFYSLLLRGEDGEKKYTGKIVLAR